MGPNPVGGRGRLLKVLPKLWIQAWLWGVWRAADLGARAGGSGAPVTGEPPGQDKTRQGQCRIRHDKMRKWRKAYLPDHKQSYTKMEH